MTDMRYLLIPLSAIAFGLFFVPAAFAAPSTQACTMQYDPVCASHPVQCIKAPCYPVYQTYGNACMASVEGASIIHTGECTKVETGPIKIPEAYTPPKGCIAWFDGCNSCSKGPKGQAMCTLRACQVEPTEPGYCTAYAPPTSTPPTATTTPSVDAPAPTPAVVAMEGHASFFQRVWAWFTGLFSF